MAFKIADRCKETTTTTGTGTITTAGALAGFQTLLAGVGSGNSTYYTILSGNGTDWEVGIGVVTSGSLTRATILSSSNSGSAISLSGTSTVFCDAPASVIPVEQRVLATFDATTSTVATLTAFAGAASIATIAAGDTWQFDISVLKSTSDVITIILTKTKNGTTGYFFQLNTNGAISIESTSGSIRATANGTLANNAGWAHIRGIVTFDSSSNMLEFPSAGISMQSDTAIGSFVGGGLFCGAVNRPTATFANIGKCVFTKLAP